MYNATVVHALEKLQMYDWALSVGFYSIYHCFLAILAKTGYQSRNQSCTITALISLIEQKKIALDKNLVLQFDTLDVEKNITSPTVRMKRELATYGVETSIDLQQLKTIKELIVEVQRETIKILAE